MFCPNCGAALEQGARFCGSCGATIAQEQPQQTYQQPTYQQPTYEQPAYQQPIYEQPVFQQPYQPQFNFPSVPANMTWKEFYNHYVAKKGFVIWMAVICFFTAAISLVILGMTGNPLSVMDILVYVISGILLLATKHWLAALVPTIYGGIFSILNMAQGGAATGIVAIVVGIAATSTLFKANKAYQKYKLDGTVPNQNF